MGLWDCVLLKFGNFIVKILYNENIIYWKDNNISILYIDRGLDEWFNLFGIVFYIIVCVVGINGIVMEVIFIIG